MAVATYPVKKSGLNDNLPNSTGLSAFQLSDSFLNSVVTNSHYDFNFDISTKPSVWLRAPDPYVFSVPSSFIEWQQEPAIGMVEYEGFNLSELGDIRVKYYKEPVFLSHTYHLLFLQRCARNDYYPERYLVVCSELELEGAGNTKEAALADMYQLLDIYYNETRKISGTIQEYSDIIDAQINKENAWKQSFMQFYRGMQKENGVFCRVYDYQIAVEE